MSPQMPHKLPLTLSYPSMGTIAFFSKKLSPKLQASSTYDRELYAITEVVKKWRRYLLGHFFCIYTNHQSVKELISQTIQTREQQKWLNKLLSFHYEIHYKLGKENVGADALSHIPHPSTFSAISSPMADIFHHLQDFFTSAPVGRKLLLALQAGSALSCHLSYKAGFVFFKQRTASSSVPFGENSFVSWALHFHSAALITPRPMGIQRSSIGVWKRTNVVSWATSLAIGLGSLLWLNSDIIPPFTAPSA
ncbi:UNVERIFIED_CONTAM: hypothetical protein Slati_4428700 [Sesamum latifolium]|uniref:Reverse transcriptase RNase H-like domain-containing protein n=1 Tax=Sesamum latifolium TaxID=2727402 RepID=A0AAW2SPY8_9LAMI